MLAVNDFCCTLDCLPPSSSSGSGIDLGAGWITSAKEIREPHLVVWKVSAPIRTNVVVVPNAPRISVLIVIA